MLKVVVVAVSCAVAAGVSQAVPPRTITLQDLTVPADRLPTGCALAPAPSKRVAPNTFVGGLWAGLPVTTNPWIGKDPHVMASISSRIEPPPLLPDAPSPNRRVASTYFLHLADGLEEAYAAVYAQDDDDLVTVYASRSAVAKQGSVDRPSARHAPTNRLANRIQIGSIVAMVSGSGGACFDSIETHVKSFAAAR